MKLQLTKLCKSFGGHCVLDKVTLTNDVNTLVVIGPSGGGKSTLLRIIAGLEYPDEGAVTIDGEPVKFDEVSLQRYRRTIGTVFQTFNLFPHLDALGNITLPLKKCTVIRLTKPPTALVKFSGGFTSKSTLTNVLQSSPAASANVSPSPEPSPSSRACYFSTSRHRCSIPR